MIRATTTSINDTTITFVRMKGEVWQSIKNGHIFHIRSVMRRRPDVECEEYIEWSHVTPADIEKITSSGKFERVM